MGWKENGKYGVSTGRTVRSPFANSHRFSCSVPGRETEYLLKFTRGTEKLSSTELDEFLAENDIDDGLGDFAESSTRLLTAGSSVHLSSISYSLKKRKRWRLPDLDRNDLELKDSTDRPNVTFIHRRVEKKLDADCIAIEKTKENEVFTPRKRKYTRVQDLLNKCDRSELEPEVGYEISYRYPTNEYPECGEGHGHRHRWSFQWSLSNPRKSRFKNKGIKNKGHRWNLYSDSEIRSAKRNPANAEPCTCEIVLSDTNSESKVTVMDAELFSELKASEERSCSGGASDFDLGCYIEELSKHTGDLPKGKKAHQRLSSACNNHDQSMKNSFKYGKKSAIYIDPEPSVNPSQKQHAENSSPSATPKPPIFQPEKKAAVMLLLNADEVKPVNLKAQWNDLYTEANSLPRRFTIDLMPQLSIEGNVTSDSYCLLFEVTKEKNNGQSTVTTDVSLHCAKTEDLHADSNFCDATAKFCSEIESARRDVWQVCNVVDYAVLWLQNCYQPLQYPTCRSNSLTHVKMWRSVDVLGAMFGWKSEIYTQREIKSELRSKIKEQSLHCLNDQVHTCTEMDDFSVELLDTFCGICYEELGSQKQPPFTALKHCRHVFCNECWEVHLKMQISLGNSDLKCPGYKCDVCVDDVTALALVPSWYNKFLSQKIDKALDASPEFRWCPSTKCGRVVKVAVSGAVAYGNSPMSVACVCGGVWCFQCGRQAHWPASCSADEKFQEVTKQFLDEMELNKDELITSVMVRNCPNCRYPIEKHLGCNFMYCIMCQTSFCWECLMPISKHNDGCQRHEQSKEVELELASSSTNRFAKYFSVYRNNKKARSSTALSHQKQRLRAVNKSIVCYKSICSTCGYFDEVLENMLQSGCSEILRSAAEFTYYAHLTLEGAAKMAIVSKSTCRGLKQDMERLQFIVEKVEELAKSDITQLLCQQHLSKLSAFLNCGKNCVLTIGQVLASRH